TLHTNSAAGAIPRLLDMQCEPFLLVSTLDIVIGQRLIRKLCETKEQYFLSKAQFSDISKAVDMNHILDILKEEKIVAKTAVWDKIPFYKAKASPESEDGYKGRIGIHEVLKISPSIKDLVMKRASAKEIEDQAKREGMLTMIEDGIFKAVQGVTTIEEVLRVVSE
ncbi:MAG: hypothetical protein PHV42_03135, partial [Candidatus Pacebacteria bacterium]|nr:hypothetical protein [Candidatus Paceibacterota bacterium]